MSEIQEILEEDEGNNNTVNEGHGEEEEEEECVYVGVGKGETSMEALKWTVENLVKQDSTINIVYLIHVFPEVKLIPNPLGAGMIPKSRVSSEQVESYMGQERGKRRDLLHKFMECCSCSKVKVETILVESDLIGKAILDLIPILHITNLVIGANKRKWNGSIAEEIQRNAPPTCNLRIICKGKEVVVNDQQQLVMPLPAHSPHPPITPLHDGDDCHDLPSCICFKPKFR